MTLFYGHTSRRRVNEVPRQSLVGYLEYPCLRMHTYDILFTPDNELDISSSSQRKLHIGSIIIHISSLHLQQMTYEYHVKTHSKMLFEMPCYWNEFQGVSVSLQLGMQQMCTLTSRDCKHFGNTWNHAGVMADCRQLTQ